VKATAALDNNANQQSLIVLIGDVDCVDQSDLLPIRHRLSQDDVERRSLASEAKHSENGGSITTQLGSAELDIIDETTRMTSPSLSASPSSLSSSSVAATFDVMDDAEVTPTDDVYKSDDVIRTRNNHFHHQPMTDKVQRPPTSAHW